MTSAAIPAYMNYSASGLPGLYIQAAQGINNGLSSSANFINGFGPQQSDNGFTKFTKGSAQSGARLVLPSESPEDKFINYHFGAGDEARLFGMLHETLLEMSTRRLDLIWRKDKLARAWKILKECNIENDDELRKALKVQSKDTQTQDLDTIRQIIKIFKEEEVNYNRKLEPEKSNFDKVLNNMGQRSGFRAIRDFAIFPFFGSLLFNGGRFFMDAGITQGAQGAFLAGTALTSAPSFLIADSVVKHLDYKNIKSPYVSALVPFVKIGTILSHTISPILNMLGIAFDFDGMVNGKSNAFGKVNNFITTIFDLFRPLSMLGFALGHVSGLNHANETYGVKTGQKDIFGKEKYTHKAGNENHFKFVSGFEKFGFWANMVGFAFWGVSQIASLVIENHEKKVNAMFEPIINELQQRMAMEQEVLKDAVLKGKISKEEAIAHLEQSEKVVQAFIKQKLLPAYDKLMEGWKTASWLVKVINWASFLGVSVQMYTGAYRHIGDITTQNLDKGMKFRPAFRKAVSAITQDDGWKKLRLYGGMAVGPLALVGGSLIEGISTVFGQDSPFAKAEGSGIAKFTENIRRNPVYELFQSLAMFG